jgi:hypothetical protein
MAIHLPFKLTQLRAAGFTAASFCDFKAKMAADTDSMICNAGVYGISGGCPFVDNLALGVCGQTTKVAHRLAKADHAVGVRCWATADGKAVGALRFFYKSSSSPPDLGNESLSRTNDGSVYLDTSARPVREVRMWYSTAVDAAKNAQLGRLHIKLDNGVSMDCGDSTLTFNDPDLKREVHQDVEGGLGSILIGGVAMSSVGSSGSANSITGFSLLILRQPTSGAYTVEPKTADPGAIASTTFTDLQKTTLSNAGNSVPAKMACPGFKMSVAQTTSYSHIDTTSSTFDHTLTVKLAFEKQFKTAFFGIKATLGVDNQFKWTWTKTNTTTRSNSNTTTKELTYPPLVRSEWQQLI